MKLPEQSRVLGAEISALIHCGIIFAVLFFSHSSAADSTAPNSAPIPDEETFEALFDVDFTNETTGWAVGRNALIIHTSDGGRSWSKQFRTKAEPEKVLRTVVFLDSLHGVAAGDDGLLLRTENGGQTWQSNVIFFSSQRDQLLREKLFWESVLTEFNQNAAQICNANSPPEQEPSTSPFKNLHRLCDPEKLDQVKERAEELKTAASNTPLIESQHIIRQQNFLSAVQAGNDTLFLSSGSTLFVSKDAGRRWTPVTSIPEELSSIEDLFFLNGSSGWLVGYDGTVFQTTDAGETWRRLPFHGKMHLKSVFFISQWDGWVAGEHGELWRTRNGGLEWRRVQTGFQDEISGMTWLSLQAGVIHTNEKSWYTADGGTTWHPLLPKETLPPAEQDANNKHPAVLASTGVGGNTLHGVGTWGLVMTSRDHAKTWQQRRSEVYTSRARLKSVRGPSHSKVGFLIDFPVYSHPLGETTDIFSPGVAFDFSVVAQQRPLKFGVATFLSFTGSDTEIQVPVSEGSLATRESDATGMLIHVSGMAQLSVVEFHGWALLAEGGLGPVLETLDLIEDSGVPNPGSYSQYYVGLGAYQALILGHYFPMGISKASNSTIQWGLWLKASVREIWSWPVEDNARDQRSRQNPNSLTQWWPGIGLGIGLYY